MHDLGHGPFSHLFDSDVVPALGIPEWSHEKASVNLLNHMVDVYHLDLTREDLNKIGDMIQGTNNGFMYQIVNNTLNSIDVDKFDYIERDCHCLGFRQFPFDSQRMMKRSMVFNDTICFDAKIVHSIYSLFSCRFNLFQQCYSHRVGQAIGLMIQDALLEAKDTLNLISRISEPEDYYKMTDSIIFEITSSNDSALNKAKDIINNIHFRKLYTQAGQLIFSHDVSHEHITKEKIASYSSQNNQIRPSDLIVKWFKLTYGNPADQVWFYNEFNETHRIPREKVSSLIPANYCDRFVRVFVKDPEKLEAATQAFDSFSKREFF